jgi:hypothetical protein
MAAIDPTALRLTTGTEAIRHPDRIRRRVLTQPPVAVAAVPTAAVPVAPMVVGVAADPTVEVAVMVAEADTAVVAIANLIPGIDF